MALFAKKYGDHIIYDLGLGKHAKISDIIEDGQWKWLVANSRELTEVMENMSTNPSGRNDRVMWLPQPNGKFSIRLAWELFRTRKNKVDWYGTRRLSRDTH